MGIRDRFFVFFVCLELIYPLKPRQSLTVWIKKQRVVFLFCMKQAVFCIKLGKAPAKGKYFMKGGFFMICSFNELRNKEVINVRTGMKLGYVDDVQLNTDTAAVMAIVVYGRPRGFGIFGHDEDIVIKCMDIELVGEDTILVNLPDSNVYTKSRTFSVENLLK